MPGGEEERRVDGVDAAAGEELDDVRAPDWEVEAAAARHAISDTDA